MMRIVTGIIIALVFMLSAQGQRYWAETVAGGGSPVDVTATETVLPTVSGMAADQQGNVYLS